MRTVVYLSLALLLYGLARKIERESATDEE